MPSAAERENFQMNRAAYNRIGVQWDAARTGFFGREQACLDTLLAGLPDGSTILDAGCGTGRPMAEYVIARGHRVVGIDQSEELLAKAGNRFPDQTWIHAGLDNYPFEGEYQAVICWDALFHIERRHHEDMIGRMADCLPTGGRLMLTVGGSDNPRSRIRCSAGILL
jgi:cyclopropane fatty-acyl-phospholipid synthase-like methyltransferase